MAAWSKDELQKIAEADDLHISPFRTTARHMAPRLGSGRGRQWRALRCVDTTARTRAGIKRRYDRRREGSEPPG